MHPDLIATYDKLGLQKPDQVKPCVCQFGDPRISALSNDFRWCTCSESSLYQLEARIRDGLDGKITVKKYQLWSVYIRALFKLV